MPRRGDVFPTLSNFPLSKSVEMDDQRSGVERLLVFKEKIIVLPNFERVSVFSMADGNLSFFLGTFCLSVRYLHGDNVVVSLFVLFVCVFSSHLIV